MKLGSEEHVDKPLEVSWPDSISSQKQRHGIYLANA